MPARRRPENNPTAEGTKKTTRRRTPRAAKPRAGNARGKSSPKAKAKTPVVRPSSAQTMRDYQEAKRALKALWTDTTMTTYGAFNTLVANLEKRFNQSRRTISEMDVRYALDKSQQKLKQVAKSAASTTQTLVKQVKLLYRMLKDCTTGNFKVPWATASAITAALLYFISPIDLIPDFIPGLGLIDDALVVTLCISVIRADLKRYAREKKLDLADYGLAKR